VADRAELHLRRRRLRARSAAALALAALALAGCGGGDDGGGAPAKLGVPVPWQRATVAPSGDALRVGYESDPCTRARAARVKETDAVVTVSLGDPDRDPKKACIGIVERHCALVSLDKPLGDRSVNDGASGHTRDRRTLPIARYGPCRQVPRL
jgi:hypothetical protein